MTVLYGVLAIMAGIIITASSTLNAQLGKGIGTYRAALFHNGVGALIATAIALATTGNLYSISNLSGVPLYLFSGGIITLAVVVGTIKLVPRIPIIYTTLSVFVGQFFIGFIIDWWMGIKFSPGKIIGFCIVFIGLLINIYIEGQKKKE